MAKVKNIQNNDTITVYLKRLSPDAILPTYAHVNADTHENDGDVGLDMIAVSVEYDETLDAYVYHTGWAMESDKHYGSFLFPRSSNRKTDCYLANSVGIIDSTIYRGEVMFTYKSRSSTYERALNTSNRAFIEYVIKSFGKNPFSIFKIRRIIREADKVKEQAFKKVYQMARNLEFAPYKIGDKIGQMVIFKYPFVKFEEKDKLSETSRGTGGHGSTGK